MTSLGSRVRVVEDHEKPDSLLVGKEGVVIGYKWNRDREERNIPVVKLDDGTTISGRTLWYEKVEPKTNME
jgi:hypothetical protein